MSADGPLINKYSVFRNDAQDKPGLKHADCELFVLDVTHDPYAVPALARYIEVCSETHPVLALDLRKMIDRARQKEWARIQDEVDKPLCQVFSAGQDGKQGNPIGWIFWCPGCGEHHGFTSKYTVMGLEDGATATTAVFVNSEQQPGVPRLCHAFIANGALIFLPNCTHALAGQTVPLMTERAWKQELQ
jgi:hypothetical protein